MVLYFNYHIAKIVLERPRVPMDHLCSKPVTATVFVFVWPLLQDFLIFVGVRYLLAPS